MKMRTIENPMNTEEMVEQIRKQCLDKEEEAIRLDGDFTARGGYVYKEFKDRSPWVIEAFDIPDSGFIINSIDPHDATPHGVCWLWVDYDGLYHDLLDGKPNIYTIREMFEPGTIRELSDSIKMVEMDIGREADVRLCDPSAWNEGQTENRTKTTFELFSEQDIHVIKGSKDMTGGNRKVRMSMFCEPDSHPQLMLFDNVKRLRWEILNYRYPDWRGKANLERKRPDKPIDKDDHVIECQRRGVEFVDDGGLFKIEKADKYPVFMPNAQVESDIVWDTSEDIDNTLI